MQLESLERAAFSAWPAYEQQELNGVVLRFSEGYTKRANSANVLDLNNWQYPELAAQTEDFFKERQQPSIFRIPSFVAAQEFDQYLAERGYQYLDKSLVMQRQLQRQDIELKAIVQKTASEWLASFVALSNAELGRQQAHLAILERVKDKINYAVLIEEGEEVACGIAVVHNHSLGIFDLVTSAHHRRKGYAKQLLDSLHQWGVSAGANNSYLQVVANNDPAIALYEKLGYAESYHYWYRIKG
ncbi:MAG: GNAT family N-acetyltransferase [Oceanospirillaceae bacterium]|nr:GNAT family N-acetyltransferase [Oceanospirillaceae bacterium]